MNGVLTFGLLFALTAALVSAGVHLGFRARRVRETGTPAGYGFAFETVRIPTVRGRHLYGWLLPAPDAARTVVVLHGWGSNAEQMLPIAAPLRRAGLNVLLVDARNHGGSDSDTFSSLPRFAEDLGQAITWLKRHHPGRAEQVAVVGHSVGAGAALAPQGRGGHEGRQDEAGRGGGGGLVQELATGGRSRSGCHGQSPWGSDPSRRGAIRWAAVASIQVR